MFVEDDVDVDNDAELDRRSSCATSITEEGIELGEAAATVAVHATVATAADDGAGVAVDAAADDATFNADCGVMICSGRSG